MTTERHETKHYIACECCGKTFTPESDVKMFFPILCWTCSHQAIADMATFLKRSLRHSPPQLQSAICDYMTRKNLMGSVMR